MDRGTIRVINKLIVRISKGDERALEQLFALTKEQLYLVAESYLFDKSKADDVISNTYMRVVRYSHAFSDTMNGYNWMYQMVKHLCYDTNKYDRAHNVENIDDKAIASAENMDTLVDKVLISNATSVLTIEEKNLIWQYYFEGYSLEEIARQQGKPKSSIHYTLNKILDKLKRAINEGR